VDGGGIGTLGDFEEFCLHQIAFARGGGADEVGFVGFTYERCGGISL